MNERLKIEKPTLKPPVQSETFQGMEGVPLFFELDEKSQKFVFEIKMISDCGEEEFIERFPEVLRKLEPVMRIISKNPKHAANPLVRWWRERSFYPAERLEKQLHDYDKTESFGTMWELVELALCELKDFKELGSGMYSPRTHYLVRKMIERLYETGPNSWVSLHMGGLVPDAYKGQFPLAAPFDDTGKMLRLIHGVLNALHQYRREFLPGVVGIQDFWRYGALHTKRIEPKFLDSLKRLSFEFLTKLSDINLKQNVSN